MKSAIKTNSNKAKKPFFYQSKYQISTIDCIYIYVFKKYISSKHHNNLNLFGDFILRIVELLTRIHSKMGCGAAEMKQLVPWFEAARNGDVEYISQNAKKNATEIDQRLTDPSFGIFQGFSAIHYAIMCEQLDIVKELIEKEYYCRLANNNSVAAPCIGPKAVFMLAQGMTILHLAMFVGNEEVINFILQYRLPNSKDATLVGIPDSSGLFAVGLLFIIKTTDATIELLHTEQMEDEIMFDFNCNPPRPSCVHNSGLFGRFRMLEHLSSYMQQNNVNEAFIERISKLALSLPKGITIIDSASQSIDEQKAGASAQDKMRALIAANNLVEQAKKYLNNTGDKDDKKAVDDFERRATSGANMSQMNMSALGASGMDMSTFNQLNTSAGMSIMQK